jgi:hypothetical protein
MKAYLIEDASGDVFAVEVENAYVSVGTLSRLLGEVSGVASIHRRKPFSSSAQPLARFVYKGVSFIITEPFGDSSRYWIGPENVKTSATDIEPIIRVLANYDPSPLRRLLGDLIMLRFSRSG